MEPDRMEPVPQVARERGQWLSLGGDRRRSGHRRPQLPTERPSCGRTAPGHRRSPSRGRSTSPIPGRDETTRPEMYVREGGSMESLVRGGTRWRRFAVVMVPSVAATAAIGVGLAQGALAASFSVSGQQFKVTADACTVSTSCSTAASTCPSGKARPRGGLRVHRRHHHRPVPVRRRADADRRRHAWSSTPATTRRTGHRAQPVHRPRPARRRRDVHQHQYRCRRGRATR